MKLTKEDQDTPANTLVIKIKFFALQLDENDDGAEQSYRVKFTKKRGNLMDWYDIFTEMKNDYLPCMEEQANQ